jgi:hypothetical protein
LRTVKLIWKPRISRKKRAVMLDWIRKHYDTARDRGEFVELKSPKDDTKFIWIFMLSKTFKDLE